MVYTTSILNGQVTLAGHCDAQGAVTGEPQMTVEILDGGQLKTSDVSLRYAVTTLSYCVDILGAHCDDLLGTDDFCQYDDLFCGKCTCGARTEFSATQGSWKREDTELTFTIQNVPSKFGYCVTGNRLELRTENGVHLTLERNSPDEIPQSCDARTAETCTRGEGCELGLCVGGPQCDGVMGNGNCIKIQGCTWDTDGCHGQAPGKCKLSDQGWVPGCGPLTVSTSCVGIASTCSEQSPETCALNPGCLNPGCVGTPTKGCSKLSQTCNTCNSVVGCSCDSESGECLGDAVCEGQSKGGCNALTGCFWVKCSGEATPCDLLSEQDCESAPGCHVVYHGGGG